MCFCAAETTAHGSDAATPNAFTASRTHCTQTVMSRLSNKTNITYAPVAQLDRVSDSDSEGRKFESCRVYQFSWSICHIHIDQFFSYFGVRYGVFVLKFAI